MNEKDSFGDDFFDEDDDGFDALTDNVGEELSETLERYEHHVETAYAVLGQAMEQEMWPINQEVTDEINSYIAAAQNDFAALLDKETKLDQKIELTIATSAVNYYEACSIVSQLGREVVNKELEHDELKQDLIDNITDGTYESTEVALQMEHYHAMVQTINLVWQLYQATNPKAQAARTTASFKHLSNVQHTGILHTLHKAGSSTIKIDEIDDR